jgi:hypothetical protein
VIGALATALRTGLADHCMICQAVTFEQHETYNSSTGCSPAQQQFL